MNYINRDNIYDHFILNFLQKYPSEMDKYYLIKLD